MSEAVEKRQHWSVDKRINLSHLFATGSLILALVISWNKMDQRITILEANNQHNTSTVSALDNRLNRIEDKLDRLIEKAQ